MKQGLFLIFAFCAISNAYAQMDCESIPSCAELGYTQASCPEGSASLKCPFDETKFYCMGGKKLSDAPAPVVTPEDWTAECADTTAHCTTLDSSCRCTACESGYLVTNGNCIAECAKSVSICAKESKIFKAETCTCEACPTNYLPVDGVCKKMCTVVANCTTYDSEYDPCTCTACENGYMLTAGKCVADPCVEKCKIAYPLFAGQDNTKAAIDQIGDAALAAYAASQFYVGDKDGDFGQGKWYLPSIGEWMYFYGTDTNQMTHGAYTSGATGENKILINEALNMLANKGINAEVWRDNRYWSSSEYTKEYVWGIHAGNADRNLPYKNTNTYALRSSLLLKDCYNPSSNGIAPKIGDVMYSDKTYGSAANYDGSKTPVGVISSVAPNERDVTIINLKDLMFSSANTAGNFDPENPYEGVSDGTIWCWRAWNSELTDIAGIQNFDYNQLLELAIASDNCPCQFYKPSCSLSADTCAAESKVFNSDTCACEDCPTNYEFNATTKTCEEVVCDLSTDTCASESKVFNSDTCACEACPTYSEFNSTTKTCEAIACDTTKVENCSVYNSDYEPCNCWGCEEGFTLCTLYEACLSATCIDKCQVYVGQANTTAAVEQLGNKASVAYAATQFYVGDKNGDFGQGKWYIPSFGEWLDFYGTDSSQIGRDIYGNSGFIGDNITLINKALEALENKGADAEKLEETYWSSSENNLHTFSMWVIKKDGSRSSQRKNGSIHTRCALLLENIFNPSVDERAPQIGDVMYEDKSYGSASDYNGSKKVVGIIAAVSGNERDVKVLNLKDLTFDSNQGFDPDAPYGYGKYAKGASWEKMKTSMPGAVFNPEDIKGIQNFDSCELAVALKVSGCLCPF